MKLGRICGGAISVLALNVFFAAAKAEIPPPFNTGAEWRIAKPAWDAQDESSYAEFVQAIGRSNCGSLSDCLGDDANPYRHTDQQSYRGDCADMAYILRAYFAWKNGLPFSYQSAMRTADGKQEDLRYSTGGNVVFSKRNSIGRRPINGPSFIGRIGGEVSTAMFRTHPETGGGKKHDDFFPVKINREAITPGIIAYDIYGHVGIVYDILEDGRILVIASHPDDTVTRTVYGPNFMRSKPELGSGLKAWRPVYLEGATEAEDGSLRGGRLRAHSNETLKNYSLEQFFGNVPHPSGEWHYGEFRYQNRTLTYYDYVRRKLAAPDFAYNPVDELRNGLSVICNAVKDRKIAVSRAADARLYLKPHPKRLPTNIFGTYGLWEDFSTPSRDARLKVSFIELRRAIQNLVEREAEGDPYVRYEGENLAFDLWRTFNEEKDTCEIIYRRTDETRVRLNLGHVMDRLFDLSFDPYHCPERRWGATGVEASTCTDDAEKTKWYNAQRFLRYQAERSYDVRMDFTADELKPPMLAPPEEGGLGVEAPADADLRAYLARISFQAVAVSKPPSIYNAAFDLAPEPLNMP